MREEQLAVEVAEHLSGSDGQDLLRLKRELEDMGVCEPDNDSESEHPTGTVNSFPSLIRTGLTLDPAAMHGLLGEIVLAANPYTEASPVAVLATLLAFFGNAVGRTAHMIVEKTAHYLNMFFVLVGPSSKARKGQSQSTPRYVFGRVDPEWEANRITSGLSSGEGLIYNVRDKSVKVCDGNSVSVDDGEPDKRLMLVEEEFAQALTVMGREGNTLSAIIRQAWDKGDIRPLTKNNPIKATGAHISIIGHITKEELLEDLKGVQRANGFANRFIWLYVERSKLIPRSKGTPSEILDPLIERLEAAIIAARKIGEMDFAPEALDYWNELYMAMAADQTGAVGKVTSRSESQVMRLAAIYALCDGSRLIELPHLKAAVALWDYSEKSAHLIFGRTMKTPDAERVRQALLANGRLTRTEMSGLFNHNKQAPQLDAIVAELVGAGVAHEVIEAPAKGRPAKVLYPGPERRNEFTN